jgi:hypothetical protein
MIRFVDEHKHRFGVEPIIAVLRGTDAGFLSVSATTPPRFGHHPRAASQSQTPPPIRSACAFIAPSRWM